MSAASNIDTLVKKNTISKETDILRKDLEKTSKQTFIDIEEESLNNIKKKIVSIDESKNILPTTESNGMTRNDHGALVDNKNTNKKKNTVRFGVGGVTKEMKREAKLINLQRFADPSQGHFSSSDKQSLPKLFEIGTFVDNHTDYFNRFTSKEKKRGTIGDIMSNDKVLNYIDKKSSQIQKDSYQKNYLRNLQQQQRKRPAKRVKSSELD
ncbi:hypothetical protein DFA_02234 [Cavenderia fasciculata]|uniref:Fcf2 pre-rRNA processing C-terminal domain-containing protein n=1 Tax=Cavenderia fasciculata TaxID=261658 RepID=F4PYW2_CACFS|nr:uncharacterized protein DFA_02234 [Cavenderia fasciculata]EGG18991.1 hypothetical protein DFA_02234 [Cavenderia fasciculata]|eukprot:XP_004357470.1 hypothetical protein DFA_02234 [Cavenderia fasciculata]